MTAAKSCVRRGQSVFDPGVERASRAGWAYLRIGLGVPDHRHFGGYSEWEICLILFSWDLKCLWKDMWSFVGGGEEDLGREGGGAGLLKERKGGRAGAEASEGHVSVRVSLVKIEK